MAAVNGTAGKPAKTVARPPNRAIVPVLPLNYPQRPVSKPPSATAATSSPTKTQNGVRQAEAKPSSTVPKPQQEVPKNKPTELGPSSSSDLDASVASTASAQAAPKAKPASHLIGREERAKDTPSASTTSLPQRITPSTRNRPPGLPNPASDSMGVAVVAPEGPIPAPHPAMVHRPAFHQPHPSNGSLIFGGFHDSTESSPAPRSGGSAFAPPPPGLLPYPPAVVDGYGRPILVSPAVDGYAPNLINHHGPPTPHSFHGSQSSVHADEHGLSRYAVNGHTAYPIDPAAPTPVPLAGMNPPLGGAVHPAGAPVSAYQSLRDQEEILSFLRHGLADETFADCVLEVRFPDTPDFQDHPGYRQLHRVLTTHGHRFVYSRSPMLAGLMKAQGIGPGGIISLDVRDEYMRSDVFWYCLRSLYGWSLADGILPTELRLRDARDDLKTALGYVATARYLQLPWVYSVAVHRASRLLFWNTIETAVAFVSKLVVVSPRNDGFGAAELLEHVLAFLIHNFPVDFVLDVNAGDYGFPRLPPSNPTPRNPNAPTIVHGTSGGGHSRQPSKTQMPRHPRASSNLRLSQIKFGDISPSKNGSGPHNFSDTPQSPRSLTPNDTILSRILLNLPFELLKQILEHPHLAKSSGDLSPSSRQAVITEIVAEREARRLRALEKADPELRVYQERVENAAAPLVVGHLDDFWVNNMGFKEEVFPGDLPYLVHTWSQATSSSVSA